MQKTIIAAVTNALSGGYWISSAASKIAAVPSAEIGSIGAIMTIAKKDDEYTIDFVSRQSPKKAIDPETKEGAAEYQQNIDDMADVFINAVSKHRNVSAEKIKSDYGQGGFMVASKAMAAGMIDEIASFEQVITKIKSKGGIRMDALQKEMLDIQTSQKKMETSIADLKAEVKAKEPVDMAKIEKEASESAETQLLHRIAEMRKIAKLGGMDAETVLDRIEKKVSVEDFTSEVLEKRAKESEKAEINNQTPPADKPQSGGLEAAINKLNKENEKLFNR